MLLAWVVVGVAVLVPILCFLQHLPAFRPRPLPSTQGFAKQGKTNVLLAVAHPDDESMFFGPTILSLAQLGTYSIHTLCFSTGNADGLGGLRKLEMSAACAVLKIPAENVDVIDHPALQDGFSSLWNQVLIVKLLREQAAAHNIQVVITFDSHGVSGHPNHRAVHDGVRAFLLEEGKTPGVGSVEGALQGWELISTNILRKYCGALEVYATLLDWEQRDVNKSHCFVNPSPWTSIEAMSQHQSQWVWYRRLFVLFSRYTYINTLKMMSS